MKNKLFKGFVFVLSGLAIYFGFKFNKNKLVFAETTTDNVYICGVKYQAPVTIYIGSYDWQEEKASVSKSFNATRTIEGVRTKTVVEGKYIISDQEDIDDLFFDQYYYCYTTITEGIEECEYETDLSINFLIVSYDDNKFVGGERFDSRTINALKVETGCDIYVPNVSKLTSSQIHFETDDDPLIGGIDRVLLTDIDNPITVNEIKSMLSAYDNEDGDITSRISVLEDYYTGEELYVDEYQVVFGVIDSAGNESQLSVSIAVQDITNPTISGPDSFVSNTSKPLELDDILETLQVSDNYSEEEELLENLTLIYDRYTENKLVPGNHELVYRTEDDSGNEVYKSVIVKVVDNVKPTISGSTTFNKSITANLRISNIMEELIADDDVDGNISNRITVYEDNYTKNMSKVGTYYVKFKVKDFTGNESDIFSVKIVVDDDIIPVFYVDNTLLTVTQFRAMSHQDIVDFLIDTAKIDGEPLNVSFVVDEYTNNSSTPGVYRLSVKVDYENKESKTINLNIKVAENNDVEEEKELSFFDKAKLFIKKISEKVAAFFTNSFAFFSKLFNR